MSRCGMKNEEQKSGTNVHALTSFIRLGANVADGRDVIAASACLPPITYHKT